MTKGEGSIQEKVSERAYRILHILRWLFLNCCSTLIQSKMASMGMIISRVDPQLLFYSGVFAEYRKIRKYRHWTRREGTVSS